MVRLGSFKTVCIITIIFNYTHPSIYSCWGLISKKQKEITLSESTSPKVTQNFNNKTFAFVFVNQNCLRVVLNVVCKIEIYLYFSDIDAENISNKSKKNSRKWQWCYIRSWSLCDVHHRCPSHLFFAQTTNLCSIGLWMTLVDWLPFKRVFMVSSSKTIVYNSRRFCYTNSVIQYLVVRAQAVFCGKYP